MSEAPTYHALAIQHINLCQAVKALYYSAHWYPDRDVDADKLWRIVRDAAGLPEGKSSSVLGKPRMEGKRVLEIGRLREALRLAKMDMLKAIVQIDNELDES